MIGDNLQAIKTSLPPGVELVAVSKFHPVEQLREAYDAGQRLFGESRAQELKAKAMQMPSDVQWHFIGHLQTNKVRDVVSVAHMIQSVDSLRVLEAIDREAARIAKVQRVLLEVHVAAEESKTGLTADEVREYFAFGGYHRLQSVHICGLMGMASNTDDVSRVHQDFEQLRELFDEIRGMSSGLRGFDILSMGMSHDRDIAIECGSTMVRIGTDIFGARG